MLAVCLCVQNTVAIIGPVLLGVRKTKDFVVEHPRASAMIVYSGFTGYILHRELKTSGLSLVRRPHISVRPPSNKFVYEMLQNAKAYPVTNPEPGITSSRKRRTSAADASDNEAGSDADAGSADVSDIETVEDGTGTDETESDEQEESNDISHDSSSVSAKDWRQKTATVTLGHGLALYRRAVLGLLDFDQCDGVEIGEFVMAEDETTNSEDADTEPETPVHPAQEGATLAKLSKVGPFWALSPLRVTYLHKSVPTHADMAANDSDSTAADTHSSGQDYETAYGLSTVLGAGYVGEWRFAVTYSAATDAVTFEATLHYMDSGSKQMRNSHEKLLSDIVASMGTRALKDQKVLEVREKQRARLASLAAEKHESREHAKRDRILHPEKYERKHVRTGISGDGTEGRHRFGAERRKEDHSLRGIN